MAHEIDMTNGRANIAFAGEVPWHGLGVKLNGDESIDQWVVQAGLNWEAVKSPVQFTAGDGNTSTFAGRSVIYRSDTFDPLGIVSDNFHTVQPREIVEFFKDAAGQANMKLEVVGSLFGGRRFWATARVNADELKLNGVDEVRPYVFLITAVDGSLATSASLVNTRVVCNNTARIALSEKGRSVRVTHASEFDSNLVKNSLGLIDGAWDKFKNRLVTLADTKVSAEEASNFFIKLVMSKSANKDVDPKNRVVQKYVNDLMNRFSYGIGSEMHKDTAWGLYCAVTEQTNYRGRGALDARMDSALFGANAKLVTEADNLLDDLLLDKLVLA